MSDGSAPPLPAGISGSSQAQNDLYDAVLRARMRIPIIHETSGTPSYLRDAARRNTTEPPAPSKRNSSPAMR